MSLQTTQVAHQQTVTQRIQGVSINSRTSAGVGNSPSTLQSIQETQTSQNTNLFSQIKSFLSKIGNVLKYILTCGKSKSAERARQQRELESQRFQERESRLRNLEESQADTQRGLNQCARDIEEMRQRDVDFNRQFRQQITEIQRMAEDLEQQLNNTGQQLNDMEQHLHGLRQQ